MATRTKTTQPKAKATKNGKKLDMGLKFTDDNWRKMLRVDRIDTPAYPISRQLAKRKKIKLSFAALKGSLGACSGGRKFWRQAFGDDPVKLSFKNLKHYMDQRDHDAVDTTDEEYRPQPSHIAYLAEVLFGITAVDFYKTIGIDYTYLDDGDCYRSDYEATYTKTTIPKPKHVVRAFLRAQRMFRKLKVYEKFD